MEPAASGLEKILVQALRQMPASQAPLMAWPLVCGSAVAERTRALNFGKGVLQVEVADASWRTELQGLAPKYLVAMNRYTTEIVQRIEFVIARSGETRS